jgi:hypothetical protein
MMILSLARRGDMLRRAVVAQGGRLGQEAVIDLSTHGSRGFGRHAAKGYLA